MLGEGRFDMRLQLPPPSAAALTAHRRTGTVAVYIDKRLAGIGPSWSLPLPSDWQPQIDALRPGWRSFSVYAGVIDAEGLFVGRPLCGSVRPVEIS